MLTDDERLAIHHAANLIQMHYGDDVPVLGDLATKLRAIAAPRVATVGELLATAPVGAIVEFVDCAFWYQARVHVDDSVEWYETRRRHATDARWMPWKRGIPPVRPSARLVPAAEADADPSQRGPLIAPEAGRVLLRMNEHFPAYAHDAAAIVALRNAATAIVALADECERLRARIAKAEEVVAAARTLGSYAWTDRLDDSRTSDDAKEDESKLSSAVWQYDNPPNLHPDGCHTTVASAFRDCSGDGHHECRTCTRFDEDERAKRIGEF